MLDRRPGLERTFFTLEQELLKPVYEIEDWSPDEAEAGDLVRAAPPAERVGSNRRCSPARPAARRTRPDRSAGTGQRPRARAALRVLDRPDWEQLAESVGLPAELVAQLRKDRPAQPGSQQLSGEAPEDRVRFNARPSDDSALAWVVLVLDGPGRRAHLGDPETVKTWSRLRSSSSILACPGRPAAPGGPVVPRGGKTSPGAERPEAVGLAAAAPAGEARWRGGARPRPPELPRDLALASRADHRRPGPRPAGPRPGRLDHDLARLDGRRLGRREPRRRAIGDPRVPAVLRRSRPAHGPDPRRRDRHPRRRLELPRQAADRLLVLADAPWFERLEETAERSVELKPNEVRSVHFRIRAKTVGHHEIQVTARGSERGRGRRRPPAHRGRPRRPSRRAPGFRHAPAPGRGRSGRPEGRHPGQRAGDRQDLPIELQPARRGPGRDLPAPYGCFEQTSSTTYPNVLALDYLRRIGKSVPQVEAKARQYIHLGYQRLVELRDQRRRVRLVRQTPRQPHLDGLRPDGVPGHGEGPRRRSQPDRAHPPMAARPAEARRVVGARRAHALHDGPTEPASSQAQARLSTTAYIAWSVFSGQAGDPKARATLAYLQGQADAARDDPYVLALVANALLAIDPEGAAARPYLDRLESLRQTSKDGKLAWWGAADSRLPVAAHLVLRGRREPPHRDDRDGESWRC